MRLPPLLGLLGSKVMGDCPLSTNLHEVNLAINFYKRNNPIHIVSNSRKGRVFQFTPNQSTVGRLSVSHNIRSQHSITTFDQALLGQGLDSPVSYGSFHVEIRHACWLIQIWHKGKNNLNCFSCFYCLFYFITWEPASNTNFKVFMFHY